MDVEVHLGGGVAQVVPASVDLNDSEGRVYRGRATLGHERRQICRAWVIVQVARNPEDILLQPALGDHPIQPAQVRRHDLVITTRQHRHALSRRHVRSCTDGAPPRCLPQSTRGGEVRRGFARVSAALRGVHSKLCGEERCHSSLCVGRAGTAPQAVHWVATRARR